MLDEPGIRKWHRMAGIILAPLIFLQAVSGMVVAFEALIGIHHDVAGLLDKKQAHTLHYVWDYLLLEIHYGGGYWGNVYHLVLVLGLLWLIMSGVMLYFRVRSRNKNKQA